MTARESLFARHASSAVAGVMPWVASTKRTPGQKPNGLTFTEWLKRRREAGKPIGASTLAMTIHKHRENI